MNLKEAATVLSVYRKIQSKKGTTVLFWKYIIDYNFKLKVIMKLHWKVFESAPIGGNNFDFLLGNY